MRTESSPYCVVRGRNLPWRQVLRRRAPSTPAPERVGCHARAAERRRELKAWAETWTGPVSTAEVQDRLGIPPLTARDDLRAIGATMGEREGRGVGWWSYGR